MQFSTNTRMSTFANVREEICFQIRFLIDGSRDTNVHWDDSFCIAFKSGASNSNCSVVHVRTYKVTRGLHYDVDATAAVPELNFTPCFLRKVS